MRSTWAIIALIVAATAAVIAPPLFQRGPGPGGSGGDTVLLFTVWGMPFEDRLFEDVYADGYSALMPGVRVDYRRYGSEDLLQKYNAWHTLGRGPDVMRLRVTDYHGMVARGMLEPLNARIADADSGISADDLADFPPHIMDILWIQGELYALPEDNAQYGLFYNKAIFDAYNAAHPGQPVGYPNADWTWEDLRDAARRLTVRGATGEIDIAGIEKGRIKHRECALAVEHGVVDEVDALLRALPEEPHNHVTLRSERLRLRRRTDLCLAASRWLGLSCGARKVFDESWHTLKVHVVDGEEAGVGNARCQLLPGADRSQSSVVIVQHQRLGSYLRQEVRNVPAP